MPRSVATDPITRSLWSLAGGSGPRAAPAPLCHVCAEPRHARDLETNSASNLYLLNRILYKYEYDEDVKDVFNMRPYYDQVTVASLRDAAREYLNTDRYVAVTLVPEK